MNSPLVSICCLAYNHAPYIRQCLDGFLMQKTNFHFEVLIHDDASTDGTSDIIREYESKFPDIIKPIYQVENQYSKGVGVTRVFQFPRAKGKYIAMCEGDDYWTDPLKLQKQVDFLENNPDYGLVYTDAAYLKHNSKLYHAKAQQKSARELLQANSIWTLTTCYRRDLYFQYIEQEFKYLPKLPFGDYPLWLFISFHSKIKCLNFESAVYRVLENSASHSDSIKTNIFYRTKVYECKEYFFKKYCIHDEELFRNIFLEFSAEMLLLAIRFNNKPLFNNYKKNILSMRRYNQKYFLFFLFASLTFTGAVRLYKFRHK